MNLSEEFIGVSGVPAIQHVSHRLAPKYTFGFYSKEDIEQEAFIIGFTALKKGKFEPQKGSLESFLYTHISNRLKTFKRDNYERIDYICPRCHNKDPYCKFCSRRESRCLTKRNLMDPVNLNEVKDDNERNMHIYNDPLLEVEHNEIFSIINQNLPIDLRADYLKMIEGIYISQKRKKLIEEKILEILDVGKSEGAVVASGEGIHSR